MKKQIIHIRKRSTKHSSWNQFYKSDRYDGEHGTICGAEMTDKDISIESCMNKYFDPSKHESLIKVIICKECLLDAMHP